MPVGHEVRSETHAAVAIQHRIGGAGGGGRVVRGSAGAEVHLHALGLEDRFGKAVPGGLPLAGGVDEALPLLLGGQLELPRQGPAGGGSPALVVHHAQGAPLVGGVHHGVEEVLAPGIVEPAGAGDEVPTAPGRLAFALQLGAAIDRGGIRGVVLAVGAGGRAVKDIVRADLDQHRPLGLAGLRQPAHGRGVDEPRQGRLGLTAIHLREGRAVHQHIRLHGGDD